LAENKDGSSRVVAYKIVGNFEGLSTIASERGLGEDIMVVQLKSKGAKPIDLATLADEDNDGVPDQLRDWAQKLWGEPPFGTKLSLFLCPTTGEVFQNTKDCNQYTQDTGYTAFSELQFWAYSTPPPRPGAPPGWDVSVQATNPQNKDMYDAIRELAPERLDSIWSNDRTLLQEKDLRGLNVLHHIVQAAAQQDQLQARAGEVVRLALVYGANPHMVGPSGETALHLAAEAGLTDVVEVLLVSDGARQAQARDQNNKRPIDLAREKQHEDVVDALFDYSRRAIKPRAGFSISDM